MKTSGLIIEAVAYCRKYGFEQARDNILWPLRQANKITDNQLLKIFKVLHEKGF